MPKSRAVAQATTLRGLRESLGLSPQDVASHPDHPVDVKTLAKAEAGKPGVTTRTLGRLARQYGVGLDVTGAAYFAAMDRGAA